MLKAIDETTLSASNKLSKNFLFFVSFNIKLDLPCQSIHKHQHILWICLQIRMRPCNYMSVRFSNARHYSIPYPIFFLIFNILIQESLFLIKSSIISDVLSVDPLSTKIISLIWFVFLGVS